MQPAHERRLRRVPVPHVQVHRAERHARGAPALGPEQLRPRAALCAVGADQQRARGGGAVGEGGGDGGGGRVGDVREGFVVGNGDAGGAVGAELAARDAVHAQEGHVFEEGARRAVVGGEDAGVGRLEVWVCVWGG